MRPRQSVGITEHNSIQAEHHEVNLQEHQRSLRTEKTKSGQGEHQHQPTDRKEQQKKEE